MPYLSTVAAFGFADFNPPTLLPLYRQLGCRGCQFYRNPENPPAPAEARRIAEDAGLPIDSVHRLFGQDLDPSTPNHPARPPPPPMPPSSAATSSAPCTSTTTTAGATPTSSPAEAPSRGTLRRTH